MDRDFKGRLRSAILENYREVAILNQMLMTLKMHKLEYLNKKYMLYSIRDHHKNYLTSILVKQVGIFCPTRSSKTLDLSIDKRNG